jgi:hypothetical protein
MDNTDRFTIKYDAETWIFVACISHTRDCRRLFSACLLMHGSTGWPSCWDWDDYLCHQVILYTAPSPHHPCRRQSVPGSCLVQRPPTEAGSCTAEFDREQHINHILVLILVQRYGYGFGKFKLSCTHMISQERYAVQSIV